jgi:hypothetical protein
LKRVVPYYLEIVRRRLEPVRPVQAGEKRGDVLRYARKVAFS